MTGMNSAEREVRQLHARYADAVWRKDLDAVGDCFSANAEWRFAGMIMRGRTEIVSTFAKILPRFQYILQTYRTPIVHLEGNTAAARTYVDERTVRTGGGPTLALGVYFDRCADEGDSWRFTWRLWQTHYRGTAELDGVFFENMDFGAPPSMPDLDFPPPTYPGVPSK